jgi:hypothetical protein
MRSLRALGVLVFSMATVIADVSPAQAAYITYQGNLTMGASSSSLSCTLGSGAENAVDRAASNIYTDKWCVPGGRPTLMVYLYDDPFIVDRVVNSIVVKHAGVLESPTLNTRAYRIYTSPSTLFPTWTLLATVTNNASNVNTFSVPGLRASRVRLDVDIPTQGANQATRIYEVEVWGTWTINLGGL